MLEGHGDSVCIVQEITICLKTVRVYQAYVPGSTASVCASGYLASGYLAGPLASTEQWVMTKYPLAETNS